LFELRFRPRDEHVERIGFEPEDPGDLTAREAAAAHQQHLPLDRFELCDYIADAVAALLSDQVVERTVRCFVHERLAAGFVFAAEAALVGSKRIERKVYSGAIEPAGQVFAGPMSGALLTELIKRIGGQFFGKCLVADQALQSSHQPRIVFREEIFKDRIRSGLPRSYGRAESGKRLFIYVHTR